MLSSAAASLFKIETVHIKTCLMLFWSLSKACPDIKCSVTILLVSQSFLLHAFKTSNSLLFYPKQDIVELCGPLIKPFLGMQVWPAKVLCIFLHFQHYTNKWFLEYFAVLPLISYLTIMCFNNNKKGKPKSFQAKTEE